MVNKTFLRTAILGIAFALTTGAPSQAAEAPEWEFDQAHSSISFSVRHILTKVTGNFDKFSGTLRFDPENLKGSRLDVEIPIDGVNTRNTRRDAHLQSEDFFDAARYPTMRFVGDTFVYQKKGRYLVIGHLTIRGVTKKIALPFTLHGTAEHPMKPDHLVSGARAQTTILRNDYGVGTGSWAATAVVGDEVEITIDIEALRPKVAPATQPTPKRSSNPTSQPTSIMF